MYDKIRLDANCLVVFCCCCSPLWYCGLAPLSQNAIKRKKQKQNNENHYL